MFLRLNANNPDLSIKRLIMAGVTFDGPVEVTDDGVKLKGPLKVDNPEVTHGDLFSETIITLRKHALVVCLNPSIGEILGYQPACPTTLSAGYFGDVAVTFGQITDQQKEELLALDWSVKLHFVRVASADD